MHVDAQGGFATGTVTDEDGPCSPCRPSAAASSVAPEGLVEEGAWGGPATPGDLERLLAARADDPCPPPTCTPTRAATCTAASRCSLADLVAGALRPDLVTASVHIAYTRAIPIGAELIWRATIRHASRSLAVIDVDGVVDGRVGTTARVVLHPPA